MSSINLGHSILRSPFGQPSLVTPRPTGPASIKTVNHSVNTHANDMDNILDNYKAVGSEQAFMKQNLENKFRDINEKKKRKIQLKITY